MLLSLCSDKPDAFGLAMVSRRCWNESSCHSGQGSLPSRSRRHMSTNRTSEGTPGEYPQAQEAQRHPQDL
jgi:hypothetical protein